jgi:hypothetical protein
MTAAERQRRHRAKVKAEKGRKARGYSWAPFEKGHTLSVVHGASSPRIWSPIAEKIAATLLADPDTPDYLQEASYQPAIRAWARVEARIALLSDFLDHQDVEAALAERTEGEESEVRPTQGSMKRTIRARRVASAMSQLGQLENQAMRLRADLGLTPASRARLGRDVYAARFDMALAMAADEAAEAAGAEEAELAEDTGAGAGPDTEDGVVV